MFDSHQEVDYSRRPAVSCRMPEDMGLVLDTWGTWRTREDMLAMTSRVSMMNTQKEIARRGF